MTDSSHGFRRVLYCLLPVLTAFLLSGCARLASPQSTEAERIFGECSPEGKGGAVARVHFVYVGHGDATIIDIGNCEAIIDGGYSDDNLWRYLRRHKIVQGPIDLVVLTHPHKDHFFGLERIFRRKNFEVTEFWYPGFESDEWGQPDSKYAGFLKLVEDSKKVSTPLVPLADRGPAFTSALVSKKAAPLPDQFNPISDGAEITILSYNKTPYTENGAVLKRKGNAVNNQSIVLKIAINGVKFLFTGDITGKKKGKDYNGKLIDVEKQLVALSSTPGNRGLLEAHVLKAAHHGSDTSSTKSFLEKAEPEVVVISNYLSYDFPDSEVIERLEALKNKGKLEQFLQTQELNPHRGQNPRYRVFDVVCTISGTEQFDCKQRRSRR